MLKLTLIRHAKAESARGGQTDWDRALEPSGQRDALEMTRRLSVRGDKFERVLSSPAVRSASTAQLIVSALGEEPSLIEYDERLYLATYKVMLAVINERGGTAQHLAVVGHNPGITELANQLSCERAVDNLPTCGVYTLEFNESDWGSVTWANGVNAQLDYPARRD